MTGEWLRTGEAARALGVSRDTVRRWVERGTLEGKQFPAEDGPTWYLVSAESVLRLLRLLRSGNETTRTGE